MKYKTKVVLDDGFCTHEYILESEHGDYSIQDMIDAMVEKLDLRQVSRKLINSKI